MNGDSVTTAEQRRLPESQEQLAAWRRLGPYLSERQWGTVREDYAAGGTAWEGLSHDQARSRAYRWGEDGIAGISDIDQHLCFALALWNGNDPILKERPIEPDDLARFPAFRRRLEWFIQNRPDLRDNVACMETEGIGERRLLAIVGRERLVRILEKMLDETRSFGDYGIRAVSKYHREHPYVLEIDGREYRVDYEPAESTSGLFGGNSNWRGPVWFPINFLLVEALQKFHDDYGDDLKVECPTGSGNMLTLWEVASELSHRLLDIFRDAGGRRAVFGGTEKFQTDPYFRDYVLSYEYFHGDNGAGIGASHQTGWTALVAKLVQQCAEYCEQKKDRHAVNGDR